MKIILSTFILCCAFKGLAQSETDRFGKWQLGINFQPSIGYRHQIKKTDNPAQDRIGFGYQARLSVFYAFKDYFGFETGLELLKTGYGKKSSYIALTNYEATKKSGFSRHYLGLPLKAVFSIGKEKLRFMASAGISLQYLVAESRYTNYSSDVSTYITIFSGINKNTPRVNVVPQVSAGIQYRFKQNGYLRIEPAFQYGLMINKNQKSNINLLNAGINVGCFFTL